MKYIKHHLASIDGIEIFPIIAFLLFFIFFISLIIMVFRMDKKTLHHIENLPLDTNQSLGTENNFENKKNQNSKIN